MGDVDLLLPIYWEGQNHLKKMKSLAVTKVLESVKFFPSQLNKESQNKENTIKKTLPRLSGHILQELLNMLYKGNQKNEVPLLRIPALSHVWVGWGGAFILKNSFH